MSDPHLGFTNMLTKLKEFFAGRGCPAYLVGGYLRDSLISRSPQEDIDIALSGDSQSAGRDLAKELEGSFVPLSPDHGKARVVVADPCGGRLNIDLSSFSGTIEEDLARRDFTINALALPLSRWDSAVSRDMVIDPFNGRRDLSLKCVRVVGPRVFQDDPGRLLRAVRLASALGFRLEPETARLVLSNASLVDKVAGERLRDEFLAILSMDGAKASLEVLDRLDLLCRIIPELAHTKGVEQPKVHYWDVWGHLLHVVEAAEKVTKGHQHSPIYTLVYWTPETAAYFDQQICDGHTRRTLLKLAALFHDIAKPQTKHMDETGRTRFPGHSEAGAAVAARRLAHLRLESRGIATVSKMVEHHLRPGHMMQGVEIPTRRATYRYFRDLGDAAVDTLYLSQADYLGAKGPELSPDDWASHARMIAHLLEQHFRPPASNVATPLVNGRDLMEHFNIDPGHLIGIMLDKIDEAKVTGEIVTRQDALALASEVLDHHQEDQ